MQAELVSESKRCAGTTVNDSDVPGQAWQAVVSALVRSICAQLSWAPLTVLQ